MAASDPYGLGAGDVLDSTPWWYGPGADNRRGTERSLGFCDPYGEESGDVRVMGGMSDPAREAYRWRCQNWAQGRYRVSCANGHTGMIMRLCYAHVWEIQHHHSRAKNQLCPRCVWPSRARELNEKADRIMRDMWAPGTWPDDRQRLASALEDVRAEMDELRSRGVITSGAPLRLEEVS